tara:strand:- start:2616 stop:3089 length:474 start_codon:yes stop_codon:yes gene_type:complete
MQKIGFDDSIDIITKRDPRYHRDAYYFLRESLDHTVKSLGKKNSLEPARHVRGPELLNGFREMALENFGPMAPTVLSEWGITQTSHIGDMVFNLIGEGTFAQSDDDNPEDFVDIFDFHDAFSAPFLPARKRERPDRSKKPGKDGDAYLSNHQGENQD